MPQIYIKKLRHDCLLPIKAHVGDAGFDVLTQEDFILQPKDVRRIPLGFAIQIPHNYVAIVSERSGHAFKDGIFTMGNIIDSTYRGEIHAILFKLGGCWKHFFRGDKIAQLLIMPCYTGTSYTVVDQLSETERGVGGFGSTDPEILEAVKRNLKKEILP